MRQWHILLALAGGLLAGGSAGALSTGGPPDDIGWACGYKQRPSGAVCSGVCPDPLTCGERTTAEWVPDPDRPAGGYWNCRVECKCSS
jgi:hypothetical protein